jgi:small subunit ribosomal protein S19e
MVNVRSIEPAKYNSILAEALKKEEEFVAPEWVYIVKTGQHRQRPTAEVDFWHKRAASILRQIYINEIVGVEKLRTRYGGKKNRGTKPSKFRKSGGKIIRTILQQAESAGFVEKGKKGKKSGRIVTSKGKEFLEALADESK